MLKTFGLIVAAGLLSLGACKKSSSEKTKEALLTSGAWKYSTAGYDLDNNGTVDGVLPAGVVQVCELDNTVTFKSDKTGIVDEGGSKCDAASPQTTTFTYILGNNDTEITFSNVIFIGIDGTVKILELTDAKMVLSKQISIAGFPLPIPVIVTLVH